MLCSRILHDGVCASTVRCERKMHFSQHFQPTPPSTPPRLNHKQIKNRFDCVSRAHVLWMKLSRSLSVFCNVLMTPWVLAARDHMAYKVVCKYYLRFLSTLPRLFACEVSESASMFDLCVKGSALLQMEKHVISHFMPYDWRQAQFDHAKMKKVSHETRTSSNTSSLFRFLVYCGLGSREQSIENSN